MFELLYDISRKYYLNGETISDDEYTNLIVQLKRYFLRNYCEKSILNLSKKTKFISGNRHSEYQLLKLFFSGIFRKNRKRKSDFRFFEDLYCNFDELTAYYMLRNIKLLKGEKEYIITVLRETGDDYIFSLYLSLFFKTNITDDDIFLLNNFISGKHMKNIKKFTFYYIRWFNKLPKKDIYINFSTFDDFYKNNMVFFSREERNGNNHRFNILNNILKLYRGTGQLNIAYIGQITKNSETLQNYLQDMDLYDNIMDSKLPLKTMYYLVNRNSSIYMLYFPLFVNRAFAVVINFTMKKSYFIEYFYAIKLLKPFIKKHRLNEYKIDYLNILQRAFSIMRKLLRLDRKYIRVVVSETIYFIKDLLFNSKMRIFAIRYLELFKNIFFFNLRAVLSVLAKISIEFTEQDLDLLFRLFEPTLLEINMNKMTFFEITSLTILLKNISFGKNLKKTELHIFLPYLVIYFKTLLNQKIKRKNHIKFMYGMFLLLNNQMAHGDWENVVSIELSHILFLINLHSDRLNLSLLYYLSNTIDQNENKKEILSNKKFIHFLKSSRNDPVEMAEQKFNILRK